MYLLFVFLLNYSVTGLKYVPGGLYPIQRQCKDCKYYVKPPANPINMSDFFGRCSKFVELDTDSAELRYKYAAYSRTVKYDCGLEGKYFIPKENSTNI